MDFSIFLGHLARLKYFFAYCMQNKFPRNTGLRSPKEYWDERANFYRKLYGNELYLDNLESLIRADIDQYKRIMELGCGIGGNLRTLAARFPHIAFTGIDLSDEMLGKARENLRGFANVDLILMDLEAMNRKTLGKQDLAFSRSVLQHLPPSTVGQVIGRIFEKISDRFYLEEVHIKGYPDGRPLHWPGFPRDMFFNHDYHAIIAKHADIVSCRYKHGIILQLFSKKAGAPDQQPPAANSLPGR
jgi:SAM-dependent methyltransferase